MAIENLFVQLIHDDITDAYDCVEAILNLSTNVHIAFPELHGKLMIAKDALFEARMMTDGS